jgi:hypothetical protein
MQEPIPTIANSRQAELDIESDSELSVLAISLFKGMDGIESGQDIGVEDTERILSQAE